LPYHIPYHEEEEAHPEVSATQIAGYLKPARPVDPSAQHAVRLARPADAARVRERANGGATSARTLLLVRVSIGVVRGWEVTEATGDGAQMHAASLMKQVLGHVAMLLIADLDAPIWRGVTARHVLSHTTGLPNWRHGPDLVPVRPPGERWGYSGEGFVLLQRAVEEIAQASLPEVADEVVFGPLGMSQTRFDDPEPGYHGYRPLLTTGGDYAVFLAHVLRVDDERWQPQWIIDDTLAWGLGWGLELEAPVHCWQWGSNEHASNFVLGCPTTGEGIVVFTDAAGGKTAYRTLVEKHMPGRQAALDAFVNPNWIQLFA
jgi:CubicO group peptidase (beta-lactamase class C family)